MPPNQLVPTAQQSLPAPIGVPQQNPSVWESLRNFGIGTPGYSQQYPRFTPEQQLAMSSLLGTSLSGLQSNQFDFEPIASYSRKKFHEETVPLLSERFAGMGGIGSSGYQNALSQAGSDLEANLAALRAQYGLQREGNLQNLLSYGLQPTFENIYVPGQPGLLQGLAGSGAQGLSEYLMSGLGRNIVGPAISGLAQGAFQQGSPVAQPQPQGGTIPQQAIAGAAGGAAQAAGQGAGGFIKQALPYLGAAGLAAGAGYGLYKGGKWVKDRIAARRARKAADRQAQMQAAGQPLQAQIVGR